MRPAARGLLLLAAIPLLVLSQTSRAQAPGPQADGAVRTGVATVSFQFDNPALQPARYSLVMAEDGAGRYRSEGGGASSAAAPDEAASAAAAQPLDRAITLAEPLRKQWFAAARKNRLFAVECDTKRDKIAFTGNKTLSYTGPEGAGSCTFNYARDPRLQQLADSLIAVANTLEEGRKLELLLSHDKLGLDAEVELLGAEQADGRALELENIAPVLHAIAGNVEVLHRTRSRAEALLGASGSGS